jgi:putative membrane protein
MMTPAARATFLGVIFVWQWKHTAIFALTGIIAWVTNDILNWGHMKLPSSPAAIAGAALGIFAAFRTNAAYARWWEGRQLWGTLVNASRMWATQATTYLQDKARQRRVIVRHALYVHALRVQLRDDNVFSDDEVKRLLAELNLDDAAQARLKEQTSLCHALLDENLKDVTADPGLDPLRLQSFDQTITTFLNVQGGSERIKRTPMPRGYGFFVERMLVIFGVLFPFTIVGDVSWVVIPVNVIVCLGFTLISETGRVLEDPFTHFYNSLPITNISTNIERNMKQRIDDGAHVRLPPAVVADGRGIMW